MSPHVIPDTLLRSRRTALLRKLKAGEVEALRRAEIYAGLNRHPGVIHEVRISERTCSLVTTSGLEMRISVMKRTEHIRETSKEFEFRPRDVGRSRSLTRTERGTMGDLHRVIAKMSISLHKKDMEAKGERTLGRDSASTATEAVRAAILNTPYVWRERRVL